MFPAREFRRSAVVERNVIVSSLHCGSLSSVSHLGLTKSEKQSTEKRRKSFQIWDFLFLFGIEDPEK